MGGAVFLGELDFDLHVFVNLHADQLILETGDEAVGTQNQRIVLGLAAFECFAVDETLEVDRHLIAALGLAVLLAILERLRGFRQVLQRLGHGGFFGRDGQLFQLQGRQVDLGDLGQVFVGDVDDDVIALFPLLAVLHLDLGLDGRTVARGFQVIAQRAVDGFLHRIAKDAGAELLLQHGHRDLALAEALHLDFGLGFFQLRIDGGGQFGGGQRELVPTLQAVVQGFLDVHHRPHSKKGHR